MMEVLIVVYVLGAFIGVVPLAKLENRCSYRFQDRATSVKLISFSRT